MRHARAHAHAHAHARARAHAHAHARAHAHAHAHVGGTGSPCSRRCVCARTRGGRPTSRAPKVARPRGSSARPPMTRQVHQLRQREAAGPLHQVRLQGDHCCLRGRGHPGGRDHLQGQQGAHRHVRAAQDGHVGRAQRGVRRAQGHGQGLHREAARCAREERRGHRHGQGQERGRGLLHQALRRRRDLLDRPVAQQEQGPAQRRPDGAHAVQQQLRAQGALLGRGGTGRCGRQVQEQQVQGHHQRLLHGPRPALRGARQLGAPLRALLQAQRRQEGRPVGGRSRHAPAAHLGRARRAARRAHRLPRPHALRGVLRHVLLRRRHGQGRGRPEGKVRRPVRQAQAHGQGVQAGQREDLPCARRQGQPQRAAQPGQWRAARASCRRRRAA